MAKSVKTAKPTGLAITRSGNKFTFSWKKGSANYDSGQELQYKLDGTWTKLSISKRETSKAIDISTVNYYPPEDKPKLETIAFRVRGKRSTYRKSGKTYKPTMSDWATLTQTMNVPNKPTLTATLGDVWNVCTFAWNVETSDTDMNWFTDVEWQTMLLKDSNETDGSKLDWSDAQAEWETNNGIKEDNKQITEDTFNLADGSYTRWFRVRARGVGGASGWTYSNHVYALPYQAVVESAVAYTLPAGGFQCKVVWEATSIPARPIDKTTVEYCITVPDDNMECPDGASWTSANLSADTEEKDAAVFPIDRLLANDQCLFIRVNTEHDGVSTTGIPILAEGGVGYLADPSGVSVELDETTFMATVEATNNSQVPDSFLVIVYRPASNLESENVVGIIEHGETSANVQAPDWSGEESFSFGVYAAVGDPNTITRDSAIMKSRNITWRGGEIPVAPSNVEVSATSISGTIRVSWDWSWTKANGAELSWADHEDAWESTDQPDRYEISNIHAGRWNISGLETGIKWYIKVRFISGNGDNKTYSPYSETKEIDLTSAPSIPTLVLSDSVITQEGSITASWVYTTTDGTEQSYAEICEATITQSGIGHGRVIAHTQTAQHVTINAQDADWQTGETYNLCVRVVSASGRVSDEWSDPVPVTIAEPLECTIAQTSLENETIETNPREFTGDLVSFDTEMAEDFTKLEVAIEPTQSGSGTPSPSNVRPIYGVGGVEVEVVGKNIFDESVLLQATGWVVNDGVYSGYNSALYDKFYPRANMIPLNCKENTSYTWSTKYRCENSGGTTYFVFFYSDGTGENINSASQTEVQLTLTSNPNKTLVGVGFSYGITSVVYIREMQIEEGTTATTYEPYTETTVSQSFDVSLTPTSTDTDPYLFKAVGDIYGDRLEEDIVGGTVAWNQLEGNLTGASRTIGGLTIGIDADGYLTIVGTATESVENLSVTPQILSIPANHVLLYQLDGNIDFVWGRGGFTLNSTGNYLIHKYSSAFSAVLYIKIQNGQTYNSRFRLNIIDLTAMFGSTIADYIYNLEQATAGSGIAWLKSYGFFTEPYYEYDAGTLKSVTPTAHVTRGVNAFDGIWEEGTINSSTGADESGNFNRSTNYIPVIPNTVYYGGNGNATFGLRFYDADKGYITNGSVANGHATFTTPSNSHFLRLVKSRSVNDDICINISNSEVNGQYFPYEEHTYDLGNVVLRGIPKLDSANNLYYDGDTYASDGTVTRKYGIVDLGTLNWTYQSTAPYPSFSAVGLQSVIKKVSANNVVANMVCSKYITTDANSPYGGFVTNCIVSPSTGSVWVYDTSYTDAATFKTAMSGVYLVYELETPTTETADPFTQIQEVSKYGTLEYITTNDVPVGHNTTYYTRDIFGGYIDLVSGQLVVTHKSIDLGTVTFGKSSTVTGGFTGTLTARYPNVNNNQMLCSTYDPDGFGNANRGYYGADGTIRYYYSGAPINNYEIYIRDTSKASLNATQFKEALNGEQLLIPLETPLTYQLTPQQIQTLVGVNNVWSEDRELNIRIAESSRDILALKEMPLTVTVTGAGEGGTTMVVIERAESYQLDRPDDDVFNGYEGETVFLKEQLGEEQLTFALSDALSALDDGAKYRIKATVYDGLGQSDTKTLVFEVRWREQALIPDGQVEVDDDDMIAQITPIAPQGVRETDVCDIYRLSADKPELVVENAQFGETYVDPYATFNRFGGYRFVFKTQNGDYITEDGTLAWTDIDEPIIETEYTAIDFSGGRILLLYNVDTSSSWEKDFQQTKYLGGSVEGDWNPAVTRNGSINAVALTLLDEDTISMIRRLAVKPESCHIRTKDGSSYDADVQVSETYSHDNRGIFPAFTFSTNRIDTAQPHGMTLAQWEAMNEDEENELE